jgi:hypothetical protein
MEHPVPSAGSSLAQSDGWAYSSDLQPLHTLGHINHSLSTCKILCHKRGKFIENHDSLLKMLFMSMGWDDVSEMRPPRGLLFIPQMTYEHGEPWWNDTDRVKTCELEKNCLRATLSTINPTWTDPGANPGLRDERPSTNRLSHGTATIKNVL